MNHVSRVGPTGHKREFKWRSPFDVHTCCDLTRAHAQARRRVAPTKYKWLDKCVQPITGELLRVHHLRRTQARLPFALLTRCAYMPTLGVINVGSANSMLDFNSHFSSDMHPWRCSIRAIYEVLCRGSHISEHQRDDASRSEKRVPGRIMRRSIHSRATKPATRSTRKREHYKVYLTRDNVHVATRATHGKHIGGRTELANDV